MTLTMGDGPVDNLPAGLDAYGGYVNVSGIGATFPAVVAAHPEAFHLSITTDGAAALCADVEAGAMSNWLGYPVGYCEVSMVNELVARYGRPRKLWTAHRDPRLGRHICGPKTCNYGGNLVTAADGTQWSNHGGLWDESVLLEDFFVFSPQPTHQEEWTMQTTELSDGRLVTPAVGAGSRAGQLLLFFTNKDGTAPSVIDVTDEIGTADPYTVVPS